MKVSAIAAVANNLAIGKDNDLMWFLPKDLKFFKDQTEGHTVIMGRKNYDSIPEKFRPFKNRTNVILTRQPAFKAEGCEVVHSLKEGLAVADKIGDDNPFIIGGGKVYELALKEDIIDELIITWVDADYEADVYFPKVDWSKWEKVKEEKIEKDHRHIHSFTFTWYNRKK